MSTQRWTSLYALAATALLALPMVGCHVEGEAFGEGQIQGETAGESYFAGAAKTVSVRYTAGMAVSIESHLGDVRVVQGSSSDSVEITFRPFIEHNLDDEITAQAHIDAELDLIARVDAEIFVAAAREAGASAELGCDIEIALPSGFSGDFVVDQVDGSVDVDLGGTATTSTTVETTGRGDVHIAGAAGELAVATAVGNVDIEVASWSSEDGYVHVTESGNITITVDASANGSLDVASQGGIITEPSPLPSGWSKDDSCDTDSGTYYLGTGEGGAVSVWTHSGSVVLTASAEVTASVRASVDIGD